jgi:hypothetical protein
MTTGKCARPEALPNVEITEIRSFNPRDYQRVPTIAVITKPRSKDNFG